MKFELKPYHRNTPSKEFIADIKRVAQKIQKDTVAISEYEQHGKFHPDTLIKRFGSWNKVIEKAELRKGMVFGLSDDALFRNIEKVWVALGRQPKSQEMKAPLSECSISPYMNRFGGWQNALKRFVEWINKDTEDNDTIETTIEQQSKEQSIVFYDLHPKRTSRNISHRLRFRILMRDGFTCRKCGASPLKSQGVELHVDHIKPWSKEGETVPDNLVLCFLNCMMLFKPSMASLYMSI